MFRVFLQYKKKKKKERENRKRETVHTMEKNGSEKLGMHQKPGSEPPDARPVPPAPRAWQAQERMLFLWHVVRLAHGLRPQSPPHRPRGTQSLTLVTHSLYTSGGLALELGAPRWKLLMILLCCITYLYSASRFSKNHQPLLTVNTTDPLCVGNMLSGPGNITFKERPRNLVHTQVLW